MYEHFSECGIAEGILGIIDSAISQCVARHPTRSRKQFAVLCDVTYQVLQNRFSKNGEGRYLTKTKLREMGKMLDVIKMWDEELYWWAMRNIAYGTMGKTQKQMSMFLFII